MIFELVGIILVVSFIFGGLFMMYKGFDDVAHGRFNLWIFMMIIVGLVVFLMGFSSLKLQIM